MIQTIVVPVKLGSLDWCGMAMANLVPGISGAAVLTIVISDHRPKREFETKPKYRNFGLVRTDTETERQNIPKPKP
jgi:hypothetical protein